MKDGKKKIDQYGLIDMIHTNKFLPVSKRKARKIIHEFFKMSKQNLLNGYEANMDGVAKLRIHRRIKGKNTRSPISISVLIREGKIVNPIGKSDRNEYYELAIIWNTAQRLGYKINSSPMMGKNIRKVVEEGKVTFKTQL